MEIKNILIAGGGMMGKNIAFVFSSNPAYAITVYDLFETDVPGGIRKNCAQLLEKGVISEAELEECRGYIHFNIMDAMDLDDEEKYDLMDSVDGMFRKVREVA